MSASAPDDPDTRLDEVVAQYLEAAESGCAPDDATLCAAHPELAGELADFLTVVDQVNQFVGPLRRVIHRLPEEPLPASFGDYELLNLIGRGGMGVVYRAWQKSLKRHVALKFIQGQGDDASQGALRFRAEAEAAAQLDHPHIVPIYETGNCGSRHFFSMKLFEGGSLADHLERYQSDPHRAAELTAMIARAVHHAHQRGILHRDLKPSNILLDAEGRPHVSDFGLAKWLNAEQSQTQSGLFAGTPAYMAPEQAAGTGATSGNRITTASDVYGLGAILYSLLTGRPPFHGASPLETLLAVRECEPLAPAVLNSRIDRDLETICLKCLDKAPDRRYPSAAAFADDLERWLSGKAILARPAGRLDRIWRWCRRNRVLALSTAAAMLALVVAVASLATGYVFVSHARQESQKHEASAELAASKLRERLYVSEMTLAFHERERGELDEVQKRLEAFRQDEQLHGFEYRWLDAEAHASPKELVTYTGHAGNVYCGTFSPDGKTAVTCGEDRSIQFWDAATGAHLRTLRPRPETASLPVEGHKEDENLVRFSPDGRRFVSGGEDGTVRLWDLNAGTWQPLMPAHSGEVRTLDFSRDGRRLATSGTDLRILVRDLENPGTVEEYLGHEAAVGSVAFAANDNEFASIDQAGIVRIWNRADRKARLSFNAVDGPSTSLAYSRDGALLGTGGAGSVRIWNAATGALSREFAIPAQPVRALTISHDGTRVASVSDTGCVHVWSLADGELLHRFKAHATTSWCVCFSPDDRRLLTTGRDQTARVWNLSVETMDRSPDLVPDIAMHICFAPDGIRLAVGAGKRLFLGKATDTRSFVPLPMEYASISPPAFSPDGNELAFVGRGGSIRRWSCSEQRELAHFQPPALAEGEGSEWNPEAIRLAYTGSNELAALRIDGMLFLNPGPEWETHSTPHNSGWMTQIFAYRSADNSFVYFDGKDRQLRAWNLNSKRVTAERAETRLKDRLAISLDAEILLSGTWGGDILVFPSDSSQTLAICRGHQARVTALAISPDRRTLASGYDDGTVRLWNVRTGEELFAIENRRGSPIHSIAFSPDGQFLAVGGAAHQTGGALTIFDARPNSQAMR